MSSLNFDEMYSCLPTFFNFLFYSIANLSPEEKQGYELVCECNQESVLKSLTTVEGTFPLPCQSLPLAVHNFLIECLNVKNTYPGGLKAYLNSYYSLIDNTLKGVNPLKGYRPDVSLFAPFSWF